MYCGEMWLIYSSLNEDCILRHGLTLPQSNPDGGVMLSVPLLPDIRVTSLPWEGMFYFFRIQQECDRYLQGLEVSI